MSIYAHICMCWFYMHENGYVCGMSYITLPCGMKEIGESWSQAKTDRAHFSTSQGVFSSLRNDRQQTSEDCAPEMRQFVPPRKLLLLFRSQGLHDNIMAGCIPLPMTLMW